jgi:cytochrome c553
MGLCLAIALLFAVLASWAADGSEIGREVAIPRHLQNGDEFGIPLSKLLRYGESLFSAKFTVQEGAGRPLSKGTGAPLSDPAGPLNFPRNFNRFSGPDANSCAGCHNEPYTGGGGDRVTDVFVLGQRFDFVTMDHRDLVPTKGAVDEKGTFVEQQGHPVRGSVDIANERKTVGMFGSGFIEMLARQMTSDLQAVRDATRPGNSSALVTKGISFGAIIHNADGTWDTSEVQGLPAPSLASEGPRSPPSLLVCAFHQAGVVVSLRQFTNNAFNQHHGMQAEERFGIGVDADGDGIINELTNADITAVTLYQATLPAPGRVHSADPEIRRAEADGEKIFQKIGCSTCHTPALALNKEGWIYSEPNPYNPPGNLQAGAPGYPLKVDLTGNELPWPRLRLVDGVVMVPAYTDLKLHDITTGRRDPNAEALDQNQPPGSPGFFAGNTKFLTKKLWGFANSGPFMHHGKFTTIREAILAHAGEALFSRQAFQSLSDYDRGSVIEFLKTLQVLPPGTKELEITAPRDEED